MAYERIAPEHKAADAARKLTESLHEYLRSGLGTARTTTLIEPLLTELHALREYLYKKRVHNG